MTDNAVTVNLQLRWGDMDANSHINNVAIARLFEESRVRASLSLLAGPGAAIAAGSDPAGDSPTGERGLVVVRQDIDYVASMPYTTEFVTAVVWMSRVGRSSFDFSCTLADPAGAVFARAETTLVQFDHARGVAVPLADDVAAAMRAGLGRPVGLRSRG